MTFRMGSPILGQDELRCWGRTLSILLCLITDGGEPLAWERPSVLGLDEVGTTWLGTTQEECKVLIISGLSGTFEEVLQTTEWGWEEGERERFCSLLGGAPYRVTGTIVSILTWNPLGPNSSNLLDKSNGFSVGSLVAWGG